MSESLPREFFVESFERFAGSDDFIPALYSRFLVSSEEVRWKFRNTDFERQNRMLMRALHLAADAVAGDQDALKDLRERAESHDRRHLDIPPEMYELWLTAVIATALEFDDVWSSEIESPWRNVLRHIIRIMTRRY